MSSFLASLLYSPSPAMMEPRTDPLLGSVIAGRYRLERRIAATDISVVYRAEDISDGSTCAVKILHAARDEVAKRCLREAEAMALVSNPHVVEAFGHGILPSRNVYIAMEYLAGESLSATLEREGALPWPRAVRLGRQIAEAVAATHAEGLIHRDIKPANCMRVTRDEDPDFIKLLDFGISKNVDARFPTLTAEGAVLGTPAYMAPELTATGHPEITSDIYSFGATLYQLLTGALPFAGETLVDYYYHHSYTPLIPPSQRGAVEVPAALEALVMRAMEKRPEARFQSMADVARALDALVPTGERPPPLEVRKSVRRTAESSASLAGAEASASSSEIETVTSAPALLVEDYETRERNPAGPEASGDYAEETPGHGFELSDGTPMPFATTMTAATPGMSVAPYAGRRGWEAPLPASAIVLRGVVLVAMLGLFGIGWGMMRPDTVLADEAAEPPADGVWVTAPAPLRPLPRRGGLDLPELAAADAPAPDLAGGVDGGGELPAAAAGLAEPPESMEEAEKQAEGEAENQVEDQAEKRGPEPKPEPDPVAAEEPAPFGRRDAAKRARRKIGALRKCADKHSVTGVIKLSASVGAGGDLAQVAVKVPASASSSLVACLRGVLAKIDYPASAGGGSFDLAVEMPAFLPVGGSSR